ncbi:MAG: GldG family protein [Propionibacteriaceae bacterium]|jgi:ABC-2 type transport system permease protein|nr:GldG family protein [Propionibacteriaceae bacterium]
MKLPDFLKSPDGAPNRIALRGGSYSLIISAVVLALLVVVNVLVTALPTAATKYDISSAKLYSVTANTKVVVNALQQDVTIYWIVQAGQEDNVIENLLGKYESLSGHISVVKRNPDVYPTFAEQYTDETVANNSLVVESGERHRYIAYDDIYLTETDVYGYTSTVSFDGEGAITSAIDYVTRDDLPRLYTLEGHGEADLPTTLADQIEKANIETQVLSLLTAETVPDDADAVLVYAPASDISDKEEAILADYVAGGGRLMVVAGPTADGTLENLYGLLEEYGVTVHDGVVVEGDTSHYAFQAPYILLPDMASSAITDPLIEGRYYVIMPIAQGVTVPTAASGATVTALLTTSDAAFSKIAGYNLSTYDKEDGDIDGPFAVGVQIDDDSGGGIVWFSSSQFLEETYNSYSSGANVNLAMNALSGLIGESEAMAIRSKSLDYTYLTISAASATTLKVVMIGVLPVFCLVVGVVVVWTRRRLNSEPV